MKNLNKARAAQTFWYNKLDNSERIINVQNINLKSFDNKLLRIKNAYSVLLSSNNNMVSNASIIRRLCTKLTHTDNEGKASMVNVGDKSITQRQATAEATVLVGPIVAQLITDNALKKGDMMTVAQLAGVLGAKKTAELIPLCHPLSLTHIDVQVKLKDCFVVITATVSCEGKTGVEMEALTAVSIAALTVYDMCKAVSKSMVIKDICLVSKTGGVRGDYIRKD